jgi:hypothetical protein
LNFLIDQVSANQLNLKDRGFQRFKMVKPFG